MPILSVLAPLPKGRFFGFYVNGVTLADGRKPERCQWQKQRGRSVCRNRDGGRPMAAPADTSEHRT